MHGERGVDAFTCPACGAPVTYRDGALRCTRCSEEVPVVDGVPRYPVSVDQPTGPAAFDALSTIYETPLWFPLVYRIIGGPRAPADDRPAIADLLDATGGRVLDVACGTGRFTRYVAAEAAFAWGVDVSGGMLRRAVRYADRAGRTNVAFARMSADDLQFARDWFDAVACCWAFHLFPDRPAVLAAIRRVLSPGGRFAGTTLCGGSVLAAPGARRWLERTRGIHVFDADELRALLVQVGFTDVELAARGAALFFGARA
ncbi:MAG: class I SAM-dependent methyltransferase [Haloferacaceae archaeon]